MKSSLVLIVNPAAKRASEKKIQQAMQFLSSAGYETLLHRTQKRGDAEIYARQAARDGASLVIAAGGDGTCNEVINGIALTPTVFGLLPLGTTNVLAQELSIPGDIEGALTRALTGDIHSVSLGKITVHTGAEPLSRFFCLMAGIGFDGEVVCTISENLKRYTGKGAYIFNGLKVLSHYAPAPVTITVDGDIHTGYAAIVGKASRYGGPFSVTPDASLQDPGLFICIMQGKRRVDLLRYIFGIVTGRHLRLKDVIYRKAGSIDIQGAALVQIDGDCLGRVPASITVIPEALRVCY